LKAFSFCKFAIKVCTNLEFIAICAMTTMASPTTSHAGNSKYWRTIMTTSTASLTSNIPVNHAVKVQATSALYGAALLRISLGLVYLVHSLYLKVIVFSVPGTVAFFESLGLPVFVAYGTIVAEIIGGAMLLVGWNTRYAALALIPVVLGATWAHAGNGWLFSATGGGWEFPLFLAVATAVQVLLGNGAFSLSKK
jgi:putative oxidoreductase